MASELELTFYHLWNIHYPNIDLHAEHRFAKPRRFRFDLAHLPTKIAIEIQGGIFNPNARHVNGAALVKEYEKMNLAAVLGWRVFYLCTKTVNDEAIYHQIATAIRETKSI